MMHEIIGRTELRPDGYPSFCCSSCDEVWHIGQSARWDTGVVSDAADAARQQGWVLITAGKHLCPECAPSRSEKQA